MTRDDALNGPANPVSIGTGYERPADPWAAISVSLSVLAAVGLFAVTPWGMGTSPDSIGYLQAARSIVADAGGALFVANSAAANALTHFAPLYSFLLAGGGLVGLDPYEWARGVHPLLFGGNVLLIGLLLRSALGRVDLIWMVGMVLVLASPQLLILHLTVLSEPLFLFLTFLGLWLLSRYLETSARVFLIVAAIALDLAWMARYAGVATVVTTGLAILAFPGRRSARRLGDAILFAGASSVGMLAWLVRNAAIASSATGREIVFHPVTKSHIWQTLYTASSWLMIPPAAPDWVRLITWGALGVCAAAVVLRRLRGSDAAITGGVAAPHRPAAPILVQLVALFVATYMAFLATSISFFDANTPLDDRILSPVYVAGVVLFVWVAHELRRLVAPRRALGRMGAVLLVAFTTAQVGVSTRLVAGSHARGWGLSTTSWQASPTLDHIRRLPDAVQMYSNVPELIYLHTGRTARGLPRQWSPMNQRPNPDFPTQLALLERTLSQEPAVVVYFSGVRGESADAADAALLDELHLRVRDRQPDGLIFCAAVCPE